MIARRRIFHVSADIPDSVVREKTRAVSELIALTSERCNNTIISLNRIAPQGFALIKDLLSLSSGSNVVERQQTEFGEAWRYEAPSKGLMHRASLRRLGKDLANSITDGPRPDMLVAHKLTVEGFAVAYAAKLLQIPYGITIQGDTDTKILSARPDLRPALSEIFHEAQFVVSFAPWSLRKIEAVLGPRQGITKVVPCPTELDEQILPRQGGAGFLSVFHLNSYRRKNLRCLTAAMAILDDMGLQERLTVVGGGNEQARAAATKIVKGSPSLELYGPAGRAEVRQLMNNSTAFVLPSRRESFGLVFVEALFAGCPIIFPRGRAVDGYFDGLDFAIPVDHSNPKSVASGLMHAREREVELKRSLADWQEAGGLAAFTRKSIGAVYAELLSGGTLQATPNTASNDAGFLAHREPEGQKGSHG